MNEAAVMDVDQVLLDYASGLREFVNRRDGKAIQGHSLTWDVTEWLQLASSEEAQATINEFARTYEFNPLDAMPGADKVLHSLMREGYSLIALTACGTDPVIQNLRVGNLIHRFGEIFSEIHFVEYTDSKADKLLDIAERYDIVAFIDDKPENLEDALQYTDIENCILMKAPHNRNWRNSSNNAKYVDFAFSWYDCQQLIRKYNYEQD